MLHSSVNQIPGFKSIVDNCWRWTEQQAAPWCCISHLGGFYSITITSYLRQSGTIIALNRLIQIKNQLKQISWLCSGHHYRTCLILLHVKRNGTSSGDKRTQRGHLPLTLKRSKLAHNLLHLRMLKLFCTFWSYSLLLIET